jgi:putative transcriptional regulator
MPSLQGTITELAHILHRGGIIDKKTMKTFTDEDLPELLTFTGEEIQELRKREHLSQAVFAKYMNVSPEMIRSLEQGKRHAQGAILKLLNILNKNGISVLR